MRNLTEQRYINSVEQKTTELKDAFNEKWRAAPDNLPIAWDLQSRIGKVDLKSEGYETRENQRDLSIKFHWGHNHQISKDLFLEGRMGDRHLSLVAEFQTGFELPDRFFEGRNILDIGVWTGGTSLALNMIGGKKITGIEEVNKYADAARTLIEKCLSVESIQIIGKSLFDIDDDIGEFDLVFYPGVIYHVSDPVLSLRILFNRLLDGGEILVESQGIDSAEPVCEFRGNRIFNPGGSEAEFNRGGWNWFLPSAPCLERWMIEAGFDDVKVFLSPYNNRVFGYGRRTRWRPITRAGFARADVP